MKKESRWYIDVTEAKRFGKIVREIVSVPKGKERNAVLRSLSDYDRERLRSIVLTFRSFRAVAAFLGVKYVE